MQKRSFNELTNEDYKGSISAMMLDRNDDASKELQKAIEAKDMEAASKIVAENETEVSTELRENVRVYMKKLEGDGVKTRTARRMVKKKFGIIVVPNHK